MITPLWVIDGSFRCGFDFVMKKIGQIDVLHQLSLKQCSWFKHFFRAGFYQVAGCMARAAEGHDNPEMLPTVKKHPGGMLFYCSRLWERVSTHHENPFH
jgi:hypothetical protein